MGNQKKTEIISIGTELLRGEITDTNARYLASQLPLLGVKLSRITTVSDNKAQLGQVLRQALRRSVLILTSGGLGPTEDDLTRESIAAILGEELSVNAELEKQLRAIFSRRGSEMPTPNLKQAMLIPSATPLSNPRGTAPGWCIEKDGKIIMALPGPPRELQPMWQNEVKPRLQSIFPGRVILSRTLKTFGISEARVAELVMPFSKSTNPSLGIYAKPDGIHLRLITHGENAWELLETAEKQLSETLAKHIWGKDENSLGEMIGKWLSENGLTLATMEDGTGGLLANIITNTAGSSQYYRGGLIAGSDEVKVTCGVSAQLIKQYGSISAEVAEGMAMAAKDRLSADFGLSTTGLMGKKNLECYIGITDTRGNKSWKHNYLPYRDDVRYRAAIAALFRLRQRLI